MIDNDALRAAVAVERRRRRRSTVIVSVMLTAMLSPAGYAMATVSGWRGASRIAVAIITAILGVLALFGAIRLVQWMSSSTVLAFLDPGGRGRSTRVHSHAEALAATGQMDDAANAFEALRVTHGDDVASLRAEAELFAGAGNDPQRASELFQRIRRVKEATLQDERYATHRLIDLYVGPLNDNGRVMVELRRMADRFPNTVDGRSALEELRRRRDAARAQRERQS